MKTAESLSQTPEQPGISLQDFGARKPGHLIGIVGMERILTSAFADIHDRNPYASSTILYRLLATQLPHISDECQTIVFQAIASTNDDISQAGIKVFTLLNMQPIMAATEPFLTGEPNTDDDLVQSGIAHLLESLSRPRTDDPIKSTYQYVYSLVKTGIAREIASRDTLPVGLIKDNPHTDAAKLIEAAFADYPLGMPRERVAEVAKSISEKTGIPAKSILPVLKDKNSLLDKADLMDEEDLVNTAILSAQRDVIMKALDTLTRRERMIVIARYIQEDTFEEIGQFFGVTDKRAQQIEAKALRKLRHPSRSHKLKPYLFPEFYENVIHQPRQILPKEGTKAKVVPEKTPLAVNLVNANLVTEVRFKYRYPLVKLRWLDLQDDILIALYRNDIEDLAQLLTKSETDMALMGITEKQRTQIKSWVTKYLEEDNKIRTLGDHSRQLLDALR